MELLSRHANRFGTSVHIYDTSTHSDVSSTGIWSIRNITRGLGLVGRYSRDIRQAAPSVVQIETGGYLGVLKSAALVLAADGVPAIVSLQGATLDEDFKLARASGRLMIRSAFRRAAFVRCMDSSQATDLAALVPGLDKEKLRIIPNFTDVPSRHAQITPHRNVLRAISVGAVGWRKGTFDLLRAVAKLRSDGVDITCEILGPEERVGALAALLSEHDRLKLGDSVVLRGSVSHEEVQRQLLVSDVFVLPSRAEGLPLALLEAMAAGLPVVATAVGAISENVDQPELPPLPADDEDALSTALRRLAEYPELRARCARANLEHVLNHLSADAVLPRFREMWHQAAARGS